ncbi:MAG: MoaD/ThiS family protein [Alkalispirochaetaceae bacterium]
MRIDVKLFATLRLELGRGALSIECEEPLTVRELIEEVGRQTGTDIGRFLLTEEGELQVGTMILVDGKNIHHLNGLETTVTSADVSIFPPAGGG